jgi:hypothetical protein
MTLRARRYNGVLHWNASSDVVRRDCMKANQILGIVLIVLGAAAFAYQGINYTTRETAIDIGPVQVTTERSRRLPLPPIVGAVALVGGVLLLVVGRTK